MITGEPNLIRPEKIKALVLSLAAGGILAACNGGGPSEGQVFEACMKEPMATEASCKCYAREVNANLPPHVAQAMVLKMQGETRAAAAIMDKISLEERANIGTKQFDILGKCMLDKEQ